MSIEEKILILIMVFLVGMLFTGAICYGFGYGNGQNLKNASPKIVDIYWDNSYYAIKGNATAEIYPYPYYYSLCVKVKDYDDDVMSIKVYYKDILVQEQFGRDGTYFFYPMYDGPAPAREDLPYHYEPYKIVVSDNIHIVEKTWG